MFKNIVWDLVGRFGSQIVSFFISIILTRLLSPHEYGIMGMAMAIITLAHVFLDLGFNKALIQSREVSAIQYSTVFYINAILSLLLTVLCYFLAVPLAQFYNQPLIKPVFQVVSLSFLLNGLNLVPSSILYKRMHFKVNSIQMLIAAILSGCVGVFMAYQGYGVWSLVIQSLLGSFILLILNSIYVRWYPLLVFSISSIRPLWSYGSKLFASGLLDAIYTRLDTFIIGKIFSTTTLGYYNRAQTMDNMVRQFSASGIMASLFPHIAQHQHNREYLLALYVKYLHIVLFISIGMSGALFMSAKSLYTVLFTERWLISAELFQLMSIAGFAWPVSSLMCNIIAGVGNASAFLRLEIYKKLLVFPVYLFGFLLGLKGFLVCMCLMGFAGVALNALFVSKELYISILSQHKVIYVYFLTGVFSCIISHLIMWIIRVDSQLINIFSAIFSFALVYLICSYLLKLKGIEVINVGLHRVKIAVQ